tara:strand:- start:1140 stop:2033 length:894 start_codon:yes stop_codon:yes gene_type:complete
MADNWLRWNDASRILQISTDFGASWAQYGIDATAITQGLMASARLGTGGAGAGAKYLADNQTFVTPAAPTGIVNSQIAAGAAIDWSKINKTGSTFTDFTTRSAADISSGLLPDARLSTNVPLINGTNAFTGSNSFATNPLNLLVGQIAFPATQNASAGANTLDDYEEGTWTPTLTNITIGNGTVTGSYIKIGKYVNYRVSFVWGSTTSSAGTFTFSLPFTSAAALGTTPIIGTGYLLDAGVASYPANVFHNSTTTGTIITLNASATYATQAFVNGGVPWTWATSDAWTFHGFYEAAA